MKSLQSEGKWKILLPFGAEKALSGEASPSQTALQSTDQPTNSLSLTIQFVRAVPRERAVRCNIGFNPAVRLRDDRVYRLMLDNWETLRQGIENAIWQMQTQGHPLPIRANDLVFVRCTAPLGPNQPTTIDVSCDFGRNRRTLIALRDAHARYLELPFTERVKSTWQRWVDANAGQKFRKQAVVHRFRKRLANPTPAELFVQDPIRLAILQEAFSEHLLTTIHVLFAAIFPVSQHVCVDDVETIPCGCAPDEATSG